MSDTPKTDRIMGNIQIAITADTREQSIAYKEEARREIENLERERNELLEALEFLVEIGLEYYDMDCGENGSIAIEQAQNVLEKIKK